MAKVIAKGKFRDAVVIVVCEEVEGEISVSLNGEEDLLLKNLLGAMLNITQPMGGTYYPERGTMLAYYHVLNTVFFDKVLDIQTEGDIGQIPYEDGVIY